MQLAWGYGSDTRKRGENQDCFGVFQYSNVTLGILCDGMGGHAGGAQAAVLAVRTIHNASVEQADSTPLAGALPEAIRRANETIYEAGRKSHRLMGMGTTVVAVAIQDNTAYIGHVGDSRVYLIREGMANQLTRDHTMVNMFVDHELLSPEDAASHPEAHVLARSLGVERQVEVECQDPLKLQPGDALLLCSDGVHGLFGESELGAIDWSDPRRGVAAILANVTNRNGSDNATLVAFVHGVPRAPSEPVTDLPSFEHLGDPLTPSSQGPIRAPALLKGSEVPDLDEPQPPALADSAPPALAEAAPPALADSAPPALLPEPEPIQTPIPTPHVDSAEVSDTTPPAKRRRAALADLRAQRPEPAPDPPRVGRFKQVLIAGLAAVLLLLVGGLLSLYLLLGGPPNPPKPNPPDTGARVAQEPEGQQTDPTPDPAPPEPAPPAEFCTIKQVSQPETLRPIHNLPRPPPGTFTIKIVDNAKKGRCSQAYHAVSEAIKSSSDYQVLYGRYWECVQRRYQWPLATGEYRSAQDIERASPLMFGALTLENTGSEGTVFWAAKATDGLQFRLDRWLASAAPNSSDFYLHEVMNTVLGPEELSRQLLNDLLIEAAFTNSLATLPNPTEWQVALRARYLYHLLVHWNGRSGTLIQSHQHQHAAMLQQLIDQAEQAILPSFDDPEREPPPQAVIDAWRAGNGQQVPPAKRKPPSTQRKTTPPKPPTGAPTGSGGSTNDEPTYRVIRGDHKPIYRSE